MVAVKQNNLLFHTNLLVGLLIENGELHKLSHGLLLPRNREFGSLLKDLQGVGDDDFGGAIYKISLKKPWI